MIAVVLWSLLITALVVMACYALLRADTDRYIDGVDEVDDVVDIRDRITVDVEERLRPYGRDGAS